MDNVKKLTIGILAHVDAGKTTLSEALLYNSGVIKTLGRVDNRDSYLDTDDMERNRGITIFSKQAVISTNNTTITLLDTPGHVDFSAEMERTLQVLDYAILVISASDGVQGHTKTLWRLLAQYRIPTFIFVNKMDQPDNDRLDIMIQLKKELGDWCIDFSQEYLSDEDKEFMAVSYAELTSNEDFLDAYLNGSEINKDIIKELIYHRTVFPCYFGSALKNVCVREFIQGLETYTCNIYNSNEVDYQDEAFGGKVYKITRDQKDERLTHMKITSGVLRVRDKMDDEKINQIRIYNGTKYQICDCAYAGDVCAVTGLQQVMAGDSVGCNTDRRMKFLEPVISYQIMVPKDVGLSSRQIYPKLKLLEEELPELSLDWDESKEEIKVKLMGQVQIEILKGLISKRFGFIPEFDLGSINYKETIDSCTIGVGHFEPLRHYAEIHLLLEPGERGSGITVESNVSEDILDKNWQRLVKTHVLEKIHKGVLTGSALTDVKVSIVNGKAHLKHTEGGDFRQATYRAIRNGLMYAQSLLLEPYYDFQLYIPSDMVGKAMLDIENMSGSMNPPDIQGETAIISGKCPVATMRDYQVNVSSYTKGTGSLTVSFSGYDRCHNAKQVIEAIGYNPDEDVTNPASSVFCAHGAGFVVPWYEVRDYMHLELMQGDVDVIENDKISYIKRESFDYSIGTDEIDQILNHTYSANSKHNKQGYKKKKQADYFDYKSVRTTPRIKERIYIIDGYNVIFAWSSLKELAGINIDSAKDRLISIMSEYKAIIDIPVTIVFDGYKVMGNMGSHEVKEDINIVHTREGETADAYIERYANVNRDKQNITVVTSDSLIRQLTSGNNCGVISSIEFEKQVEDAKKELRDTYKLD